MQKLILLALIILVAIAVSCGASKKENHQDNPAHKASAVSLISADTIKVGNVEKTEQEWKQLLSNQEYQILREEGTERPFSSDLLKIKKQGIYYCAACGLPLYSSETKFKTGTGWPSFYQPIDPKVVTEKKDRSMGTIRTEIKCAQCGSHIGHVFKDGPEPTGLRYCMNGAAMTFKEK